MRGRWKYVWAIAFVLLVAFIIVRQLRQPATNARIVLPDGREIAVRGLTIGTNSTFVAGNLFQRTIGRKLPATLKARFKVREMQVRPDPAIRGTDLLVAWVEARPPTNIIVRVADDSGREQIAAQANASGGGLSSGGWLSAHAFSSFPRRTRFLTLRVYSVSAAPLNKLAEFRVANPACDKYPVWKPEPLPIMCETNGAKFTITHFNTGLYATGHVANMGSNWTEIIYNYEAGPWRPLVVTVTDATGNRIHQRTPMQRLAAGPRPPGKVLSDASTTQGVVSLPAMLWLNEPAWKVQLELEPSRRSSFPSNTWWELHDVAVPPRGQTNQIHASHPDHGTNVIFKSLAAVDGRFRIDLQRSKGSPLRVTLLQVTDHRGTKIAFAQASAANADAYVLDFAAAEAPTLNFRFAVHQRVTLEFLARPQLLHTNIAKDQW